ncbi:hypothetical protein BC332_28903 [Capsicum chinense]|nr:hypothetical protein BC332_28903 [Capsicum chinense]
MVSGTQRKYFMLGGKGGVGKTSCAASLADLTGGALVPIQGVDSPLYTLEINPEKTRKEFHATSQIQGDSGVKNFMDSMGRLGMLADQEHTLRLLSLPDFLDVSIGKVMKLKKKIAPATSALKSMFNKEEPQRDDASDKLEQLRERMAKVRDLFHDSATTEFIIVTIPTVMAINESSRLCASLKKETVPVRRLIVNQILPPSTSECKFCLMRRKDQMRALDMITKDPELASLKIIQAPLVDVEIRGVAGLKFMGDLVWK